MSDDAKFFYEFVTGYLADDGYDPTYGDGGVRLGREVYDCLVCGALVTDKTLHVEWHRGPLTWQPAPARMTAREALDYIINGGEESDA